MAELNSRQGAIHITPHLIPLFQRHKHNFDYLVNRRKLILFKRLLICQKGGALPIVVPLLATDLGSLGGEFISRLLRKNDKEFSKKVLIEQAEVDQLQQRQIRELSSDLHAMARLQKIMRDFMANKILTAEERYNSISDIYIRC